MATHPIPAEFDLVAQLRGTQSRDARGWSRAVQRRLYDRQQRPSVRPGLSVEQQEEVFVTVLTLALVKLVNGIEEIRKA